MEEFQYKFYLDEGIYNFRNGNYKTGIDLINKSIELNPDFSVSYFYRGACYQALECNDKAILDYTKTIELDNKMIDAYYNRAKIVLSTKNIDELQIQNAISDLNYTLEIDPLFQDSLFALGAAYKKLEQYEKAIEILQKLVEINPEHIYGKALLKLIFSKYMKNKCL